MENKRDPECAGFALKTENENVISNLISSNELLENKILRNKNKILSTKSGVFHQILVTCSVLLCAASCGMPIGYSAVLLPQLYNSTEPLNIDIEMGSWIASIHSLATPVGSFISGPIADRYGRKPTLFLATIPLIAGWALIALAQSHISILVGRILTGIAVGLVGPAAQILLAEVAEPQIRGILIGAPFVSYSMGILIVYALGTGFHWRIAAWYGLIIPILSGITILLIPESPVWLVRHDQLDKANKTLLWIRGDKKLANNELDQLVKRFEDEKLENKTENFFQSLFTRKAIKPLIIINLFNLLVIFSGTYLIVFYAIDIISEFGVQIDTMKAACTTALVRLICTFIFCFLILTIKRRNILIISGCGSGLSCIVLGLYIYLKLGQQKTLYDTYFMALFIVIYLCFNSSFMIMPGIMVGELLPTKVRAQIAGYIFAISHILTFGLTKIFPLISFKLKIYGLFWMFGLCSFICSFLMWLLLPETKGKSLGEIEDYFNRRNWFWFSRNKHNKYDKNDVIVN